ncbi:unnamed protein product [Heterobilharzia americana]|nr:unnamed protein product [Heterobilharzia americana]
MNGGNDVSPATSASFSCFECNYSYTSDSEKSSMISAVSYQRLFVGLRRPSYLRSSYHRILRTILYLCLCLTLVSLIWLTFYISDSSWISHISVSPYPRDNTLTVHNKDNNNMPFHHTGSRVHIFKLHYNPFDHFTPFKLLDDIYHQVKPGLSAYSEKPEDAANSISKLIHIAETSLPTSLCHNTPVILRATAGLRLLSTIKAENILKAVRNRLSQTCFKQLPNAVTIMDGFYEGLYLWLTLNFLNDRLSRQKLGSGKQANSFTQTIGTLDLGGGSTQITFIPTELDTFINSPSGFITNFDPTGHNSNDSQQKIYSHSYLGLGLMSARYSVLHNATGYMNSKFFTKGKKQFFYPCWPINLTLTWNHAGYDWEISRMNQSLTSLLLSSITIKSAHNHLSTTSMNNNDSALCYALALTVLQNPFEGDGNTTRHPPNNFIVHQAAEVKKREFYAFSYYFDLAVSAGLIDEDIGGFVTAKDFQYAAEQICIVYSRQTVFFRKISFNVMFDPSIRKLRGSFKLTTFKIPTFLQFRQKNRLVRSLENLAIGVCCISEIHIQDSGEVLQMNSASISSRSVFTVHFSAKPCTINS